MPPPPAILALSEDGCFEAGGQFFLCFDFAFSGEYLRVINPSAISRKRDDRGLV